MRWVLIFAITFLCFLTPAQADEPFNEDDDDEKEYFPGEIEAEEPSHVRYRLPEVKTNVNGEKCLNVEQWKAVLIVGSEYKRLFDWRLEIDSVVTEYGMLELAYMEITAGYQKQIEYLETERDSLRLRLKDSEDLSLKLQKGYRIEKGFMWAVIVIETAVIGFLGVRSAISR